jgi:hypothetical protein
MAQNNSINNTCTNITTSVLTTPSISFDAGTNKLSTFTIASTSWDPNPTFSGANTGMSYTYSSSYSRIGNIVLFYCTVAFSNKGSSTGSLQIDLPVSVGSGTFCYASAALSKITTPSARDYVLAYLYNASTYPLRFSGYDLDGSTSGVTITESEVVNDSSFRVHGWYFIP